MLPINMVLDVGLVYLRRINSETYCFILTTIPRIKAKCVCFFSENYFYVPCPLMMSAVMVLHNFLFLLSRCYICLHTILPRPCFACHLYNFHTSLELSVCPLNFFNFKFFETHFLHYVFQKIKMCLSNSKYRRLFCFFENSSLLTCFSHGILSNFL